MLTRRGEEVTSEVRWGGAGLLQAARTKLQQKKNLRMNCRGCVVAVLRGGRG